VPQASPPPAPVPPFPLKDWEVLFIKETVERFYGKDVVVRNFGPEPSSLEIHVETNTDAGMERHECLGILMAKRRHHLIERCRFPASARRSKGRVANVLIGLGMPLAEFL
jgi:hypothetical protein